MPTVEVSQVKPTEYFASEAYKTIRTNLEFCGDDIKVIAVTSCVSHEGKSTVSMNMGMYFADLGKKVLFIDTDLRKSMLSVNLKISKSVPGLTHFLSGKAEVRDVILHTDADGFDMIYAGANSPDPTELLGSKRFKDLIAYARGAYDYVVVDTPPLGTVIDCAVVAPQCDGAVILIAANEISYRFAHDVKSQLQRAKCRILGVVLNKTDISKTGYSSKYYRRYKHYGYGHRYGYGYGYSGHDAENGEQTSDK